MEKRYHNMKFKVIGRTLLIELSEDLDHHNAVYVRELSDEMQDKHLIQNVVFDFSGVEFMDSSGIGVIMGRQKRVSFSGGTVKVAAVGKNVDRIFQMAGLYKLVKRYDTVEEALG